MLWKTKAFQTYFTIRHDTLKLLEWTFDNIDSAHTKILNVVLTSLQSSIAGASCCLFSNKSISIWTSDRDKSALRTKLSRIGRLSPSLSAAKHNKKKHVDFLSNPSKTNQTLKFCIFDWISLVKQKIQCRTVLWISTRLRYIIFFNICIHNVAKFKNNAKKFTQFSNNHTAVTPGLTVHNMSMINLVNMSYHAELSYNMTWKK